MGSVDDGTMPESLVTVLRRYAAAASCLTGFFGAVALAFFGYIEYTGCFIECQEPSQENPTGSLLITAAIALIPATLVVASRVASADHYLQRGALATAWLVTDGTLLLIAANTDLVDATYPEIDLLIVALASGITGAVLIAARAATVPAVIVLILVVLASLVRADTIGPIAVPLTLAALSINPRGQRYSA